MTDLPTIAELLNDIDNLMLEDPLNLSLDENTLGGRKLRAIIAYHRRLRAEREAGKGRAARAANAPKVKLDLAKLGLVATPGGGSVIKRRV